MKTSHAAALAAVVTILGAFAPGISSAQSSPTIPAVPTGWLTAFPTVVHTGTKPTLTWNISHPAIVQDYVTIEPPATINPKTKLEVEVRVLGAGVTVSTTGSSNFSFVPTEAVWRVGGSGGGSYSNYKRIFYGTNLQVKPNQVVAKGIVNAGTRLRFGGRYYYNNQWAPSNLWYHSGSGSQNVRALVNGDTPPPVFPHLGAPSLEDFIKPYLDAQGRVKIGPMDVIVFMELTHTDSQQHDEGYDLQDMVLLVTFKPASAGAATYSTP